MTPERAAYHRLMLAVGFDEEYYDELNEALETEDPLSDLTLALVSCESNLSETLSVLKEYNLVHPANEETVYQAVTAKIWWMYNDRDWEQDELIAAINILSCMDDALSFSHRCALTAVVDYYNLKCEGIISEIVFVRWLYDFWEVGNHTDIWALQRQSYVENNLPKIRQNLRDSLVLCLTSLFMGCLVALTVVLEIITRGFANFAAEDWFLFGLSIMLFGIFMVVALHNFKKYRYNKKLLK